MRHHFDAYQNPSHKLQSPNKPKTPSPAARYKKFGSESNEYTYSFVKNQLPSDGSDSPSFFGGTLMHYYTPLPHIPQIPIIEQSEAIDLMQQDSTHEHLFEDFGDYLGQCRQTQSNFSQTVQLGLNEQNLNSELYDDDEHSIYDNEPLLIRGFDCDNWRDVHGKSISMLQLYKVRSGTYHGNRENLKNSDVVRLLHRFSKNQPSVIDLQLDSFDDSQNYADDSSLYHSDTFQAFNSFQKQYRDFQKKKDENRQALPVYHSIKDDETSEKTFTTPKKFSRKIVDTTMSPPLGLSDLFGLIDSESRTLSKSQQQQVQLLRLQAAKLSQENQFQQHQQSLQADSDKKKHLLPQIIKAKQPAPGVLTSSPLKRISRMETLTQHEQERGLRCTSEISSPRAKLLRSELNPIHINLSLSEVMPDKQNVYLVNSKENSRYRSVKSSEKSPLVSSRATSVHTKSLTPHIGNTKKKQYGLSVMSSVENEAKAFKKVLQKRFDCSAFSGQLSPAAVDTDSKRFMNIFYPSVMSDHNTDTRKPTGLVLNHSGGDVAKGILSRVRNGNRQGNFSTYTAERDNHQIISHEM